VIALKRIYVSNPPKHYAKFRKERKIELEDGKLSKEFDILNFFQNNHVLVLVLLSIVVNIIGLGLNVGLFYSYGFSYLDFAQTSDLIFGAFKSPAVIIYFVVVGGFYYVIPSLSIFRKRIKIKNRFFKIVDKIDVFIDALFFNVRYIVFFYLIFIFPFSAGMQLKGLYDLALINADFVYEMPNGNEIVLGRRLYFLFGIGEKVKVYCEIKEGGKDVQRKYEGLLVGQAGALYLFNVNGKGLVLKKSCVNLMEVVDEPKDDGKYLFRYNK
jgi:hypothetical protein